MYLQFKSYMYRAYETFRWRRHIPSVTDYERSRKRKVKTTLGPKKKKNIALCSDAMQLEFEENNFFKDLANFFIYNKILI